MLRTLLVSSMLLVGLVGSALPAQADPVRELEEYSSVSGADGVVTVLACRERATSGRAWRVYLQLDNRRGWGTSRARYVTRRHGVVVARWTSAPVARGAVSRVRSIRVPARPGLTARIAIDTSSATAVGVGPFDLARC